MFTRIQTVAFQGIEVLDVDVQVQLSPGMPKFQIGGLPDKAVAESRERVRAALHAMGLALPTKHIAVNLSPADIQKEGSHFDLPIALGLLVAMRAIPSDAIENSIALGELALDGKIAPVSGVLPAAIHASAQEKNLICPQACGGEAAWADDVQVLAPSSLLAFVNHVRGIQVMNPPQPEIENITQKITLDLRDIKGQKSAKRALEVVAAGGHNMLMVGPPGAGKSMLAARLPGILPPLEPQEALDVTMIHSLAGKLKEGRLIRTRPFRDPHHSASMPSLVGGGLRANPGEVSLAHLVVLFLDELPEFQRGVLEALRQPLETGKIMVSRANAHATYPARVQLIAAMNPCRCGHMADSERACSRAPQCGADYQAKISGPILDRIDIHIDVPEVSARELTNPAAGESSEIIAQRVLETRQLQLSRYKPFGDNVRTNAEADGETLDRVAPLDKKSELLLKNATEKFKLSARGYRRVQRVTRTLADLEKCEIIKEHHVAEALSYRRIYY